MVWDAPSMLAQSNATDGALNGYVRDASGLPLDHSSVTLINEGTNVSTKTTSASDGYFRFPLVPVGTYTVSVRSSGFQEYIRKGVSVVVGAEVSIPATLTVGSENATVTVTANASMLDESTQAVGGVISEQEMDDLPLTSRNVYNLFLFTPGAKGIPSSTFATPGYSFGGVLRSTWNVDGLDDTSRATTSPIRLVINTAGTIRQIQVLSNGYGAEFGRSVGGQTNIVTRSGENKFHGSAMYLNRPQALSAIPSRAKSKADLNWNMYAFNFGGPIKRDKLFFFANWEHNPYVQPNSSTIKPATITALGLTPADVADEPHGETYDTPSARVDYRVNAKNHGFLRYSRFTNMQDHNGTAGLYVTSRASVATDKMNGGEVQLASTPTAKLLNELRFGVNRREVYGHSQYPSSSSDVLTNISGYAYLGTTPSTSGTIETADQVVDNVSWQKGRHFIKFGGDWQISRYLSRAALNRTFTFGGLAKVTGKRAAVTALNQYLYTTQGLIDPATNRPYTYTTLAVSLGDPTTQRGMQFVNAYVQDEYRITPKLVATAGLRWEKHILPQVSPDSTYAPAQFKPDSRNMAFAPRLAVAYTPNPSLMIRSAFGLFYDVPNLTFFNAAASNDGTAFHSYTLAGSVANAPVYPNIPDAVAINYAVRPTLYVFAQDFKAMYGVHANVQIEQVLTPNMSLHIQYMYFGTRFGPYLYDSNLTATGTFLEDGRPVYTTKNRPDSNWGAIDVYASHGNTNYHGLDVTLNKRLSHQLLFSANYSWSHALGDSDQNGYILSDPSNLHRDYGNLSTDVRHYFIARALYTTKTDFKWLRWSNGIGLSTMTMITSGYPLNPLAGADLNGDLSTNDRPLFAQRNSFRGPNYYRVDARASKCFTFKERYKVEVMAEAENLLNHVNAACSVTGCNSAVNGNVNSAGFGDLTVPSQTRRGQVGARLSF